MVAKKVKKNALTGTEVKEAALGKVPASAHADGAPTADQATNATNATNADAANQATNAIHAGSADTATNATNSDQLGGLGAALYQRSCANTGGSVLGYAKIAASATFSSALTTTGVQTPFNCSGGAVYAARVWIGDYHVLFCGLGSGEGPAVASDTSFSDFVSVNAILGGLISPCPQSTNVEFRVVSRDAGGTARDQPFTIVMV